MTAKCTKKFLVVIDGRHRSPVCAFLRANRETFDRQTRREILALKPGQTYRGGGGAWADWSIRRPR